MTSRFKKSVAVLFILYFVLISAGTVGVISGQTPPSINPADPNVCYASTGTTDGGKLYTIDTATGAGTLVGDITDMGVSVAAVPGLAISSNGTIFGTTKGTNAQLLKIDAASGAGFSVGNTGQSLLEAIAFDASDVLYGVTFFGTLLTIDTTTAAVSIVGVTDSTGWAGLAFDPTDGKLYASKGGQATDPDGIYTINPLTAADSKIGDTDLGGATPDLHFDINGNLFGSKGGGGGAGGGGPGGGTPNNLISINKTTAAGSAIGAIGVTSVSGLALLPMPTTPLVFRVERSTGDVFADGSFIGGGADMAERINVSEPVEAGDVVELDPDKPQHYRKARRASSHLIAGVITTEPGFILGNRNQLLVVSGQLLENEKDERPMLALLGRVPVKATTENGAIHPGDLLTVSNKPGYVMRCAEAKGCAGAIIGKALEDLDRDEGMILMLVMSH